jgi:hypothetical protein
MGIKNPDLNGILLMIAYCFLAFTGQLQKFGGQNSLFEHIGALYIL